MSAPYANSALHPLPKAAELQRAAGMLSLLSNPVRLEILCHLSQEEELSVGGIGERVNLSPSALSQHLAKMRHAGLVERRRERQTIHYRIAREDVGRILELLHDLYCAR